MFLDVRKQALILTCAWLTWPSLLGAQTPTPTVVDSPGVKVLTGLLAPDFQEEMNHIVQAVGGSCNTCHIRGNFASEDNQKKIIARRML